MLKIQNRRIRLVARALLYFAGFIFLLFAALSIYIEVNQKEMLAGFNESLNKKINGTLSYSKADLSVWRNFPHIGLHVSDAALSDSLGTPLLKMKEISFSVSVIKYLQGSTKLKNLSLKNGTIHLFTDTAGYTNKYLFDSNPKANQQKNKFDLDGVTLKNVNIIIENWQKNKKYDVLFKNLDADIAASGEIIKITLDQSSLINGLGFNLLKGSYLKGQTFAGKIKLKFDKKQSLLSFNETKIKIDNHPYMLKGEFRLNTPGSFHLDVTTKKAPFEKLRKLFAENVLSDMKTLKIEKPFDVSATLQGSLGYKTIPKVSATWQLRNNSIVTPVATLSDCGFDGVFTNEVTKGIPLTDENSGIALTGFSGNWEGIQLKGKKISITNLVVPYADMSLQSSTDLKTLNEKLGLKTIQFLNGVASLSFEYTGLLQKDVSIIDKLRGRLQFSNGTIKYLPRDFTFNNCSGDITFSEDALHANGLKFDLGSNHFNVAVAGTNLSALSTAEAGKAVIRCNVSSPSLNLVELRSLFAGKKQIQRSGQEKQKGPSAASKIDKALDDGQLTLSLNAATVKYNNFNGKDLRGTVSFYNNDLVISGVSIAHADGSLVFDGKISQQAQSHTASAKVKLNNVDVAKVFKAFDDFGQDGISHQNLRGRLNANTNISMSMDDQGKIIPGTMKGLVDFSLKNGVLVNYEPMENIKGFVFKNKDMSHVAFAELKNKLDINNYKIKIPRMEIQSTAIGMFVEGVYDLKKIESKIDIQVPLKGLKKRDSAYVPQNIGVNTKAGTSVYLEGKNDKTGKVKIGLNTGKTIRKIF